MSLVVDQLQSYSNELDKAVIALGSDSIRLELASIRTGIERAKLQLSSCAMPVLPKIIFDIS
jgi:hypothetical protein